MAKKPIIFIVFIFFAISYVFLFTSPRLLNSAPPTSVKDTLSSSQLSYFANLAAGNSLTDTLITIETSGNPSNTTNNLFVGDTLSIGNSSTTALSSYVVRDIGNTAQIQVDTGLSAENRRTVAAVIATHSAIHTVSFTPKSSITAGAWQFLIKATSRTGEDENDGQHRQKPPERPARRLDDQHDGNRPENEFHGGQGIDIPCAPLQRLPVHDNPAESDEAQNYRDHIAPVNFLGPGFFTGWIIQKNERQQKQQT